MKYFKLVLILSAFLTFPAYGIDSLYGKSIDKDQDLFLKLVQRSGYKNVSSVILKEPSGFKNAVKNGLNGALHAAFMQAYYPYSLEFNSNGAIYQCDGKRVMNVRQKKVEMDSCKIISGSVVTTTNQNLDVNTIDNNEGLTVAP